MQRLTFNASWYGTRPLSIILADKFSAALKFKPFMTNELYFISYSGPT